MINNWLYLIIPSAFCETDFFIASTFFTIVSSIAAIFITLIFCVKKRSSPTLISKGTTTMSAPSPGQPGTPNQKPSDGKSPMTKKGAGNEKLMNNGKNAKPGQSFTAEGGINNPGENGLTNQLGNQKIDSKDGSKAAAGGTSGVTAGGFAVTTAKTSGKHQEKNRDILDVTQKSLSTKKKKKTSAEQPKDKKSKTNNLKNGAPIFAQEMDVGSDEETLQNVKSLEKEVEHSFQDDVK